MLRHILCEKSEFSNLVLMIFYMLGNFSGTDTLGLDRSYKNSTKVGSSYLLAYLFNFLDIVKLSPEPQP